MNKILIFAIISLVTLSSCEKVIDLDLNSVSPKLVIEGTITNTGMPDTVKLSKTINFQATNEFVGVANALVIVTDNTAGIIDTLRADAKPGYYITSKIIGTQEHQYSLRVVSEGKEYTAQSTMPQQVMLDSMYQETETILGKNIIYARCRYTDPANQTNQYHVKAYKNNKPLDDIIISKDTYNNGLNKTFDLATSDGNSNKEDNIAVGDTIKINFMCIDKKVYDYFNSLAQTLDANSAVLANPLTNISGGCLGYFSAHTVETKKIVIQ
ncbi:MAG: DUF4249 domain-containing protein [Paludibacteraceae bacterium]|nr:DUF4249 domain-containing protein [Paludibacteraceae bacterium]